MNNVNFVIEIGRLTANAVISYTAGGTPCANFSIAVNESQKDAAGNWNEYVNFFDVVLWGKQGESLKDYLTKGKQVAVVGRLHQDRWQKDGKNQNRIRIKAENIQLLGGTDAPQAQQTAGSDYPADIPF